MTRNDTLLDATKQLIAIRSTSDNSDTIKEAIGFIESRLRRAEGITIEQFTSRGKPSLLAYYGTKRPSRFRVLLNGHIDVVPALDSQYQPTIHDGRLYGRGALDMKTAAMVLCEVFCRLASKVDYPLGLQIVADEEIGGQDGTAHQIEQGVDADFVLAGEFTNLDINIASKGLCQVKVTARGVAAHSAYLWEGGNALSILQTFTQNLLAQYPVPKHEVWRTTVNLASISTTNTTLNRVPDTAEALLDIRYIPEDKHFATRKDAQQFLASFDQNLDIETILYENCHTNDPDDPYVQILAQAIISATARTPRLYKKNGASDVRFYSERGCSAVTFGLAGEGLHSDNEYVSIDSIADYRKSLETFLSMV